MSINKKEKSSKDFSSTHAHPTRQPDFHVSLEEIKRTARGEIQAKGGLVEEIYGFLSANHG
jgi:hypothetical protein